MWRTRYSHPTSSCTFLSTPGSCTVLKRSSNSSPLTAKVSPTGNRVEVTGIDIVRVTDGKLAEGWVELDGLAWLQQLGAIPAPGQSEEASPT
jgi:hypothetical protein